MVNRRSFVGKLVKAASIAPSVASVLAGPSSAHQYDLIVISATPAGIMAAIAAARGGVKDIALIERTRHIGGLCANGLGATDIHTRGATGGLFLEFTSRIKNYYLKKYGAESQQLKDCSDGYHFEPSVAESVFENWLAEYKSQIKVFKSIQWEKITLSETGPNPATEIKGKIVSVETVLTYSDIRVYSFARTQWQARYFIDASYEGDIMQWANVPWTYGREAKSEYNELGAGKIYKYWGGPEAPGSTGEADKGIQAFNYRLCLTKSPDLKVPFPQPPVFNREDYISLIDDLLTGRHTGVALKDISEVQLEANKAESLKTGLAPNVPNCPKGIQRLVNCIKLPNGKTDANNQHFAFISTDLPGQNWRYPLWDWSRRDRFAEKLKNYTLGLFWFAQNDPDVPAWFKKEIAEWGLCKTEYLDNNYFPRQMYVREARRMKGKYLFKAQDALPEPGKERPPFHPDTITASHYALDSHAVNKREPGKPALDGFLSYHTKPYTVPFGVMLPSAGPDNLLVPVAVSATHIGFSTLRMEPCWMALGEAAGTAVALSIKQGISGNWPVIRQIQLDLILNKAVLTWVEDVPVSHKAFKGVQYLALHGLVPNFKFLPEEKATLDDVKKWADQLGQTIPKSFTEGNGTRAEVAIAFGKAVGLYPEG